MIKLKRAYDRVSPTDGKRLLVERLWPRGISKERLKLHGGSFALATFGSSTPDRSHGVRSFLSRDAAQ
jgi:Protein of unknown function, DUF488